MTTVFETAMAGSQPRLGIFFRLDIAPKPFRMWLGIGDCKTGIDAKDSDGRTYYGLGEILNVPVLTQLVNGAAERIELRVSGVSQRMLAMASTEADEVKGVTLLVGVGAFDQNWQLLAAPTWLRRFLVDYLSVQREQSRSAKGDVTDIRTITLSVRTAFTARRRPRLSYFTDAEQQAVHPGDRFCELAATYSAEVTKVWPRFPPP